MTAPTPPLTPLERDTDAMSAVMAVMGRDFASIPEPIRQVVVRAQASGGVTPLCESLEAFWAVRDLLSPESRDDVAQVAQVAARSRFGAVGQTGRATGMYLALRRDRGEAGEFPASEDDPPADSRMAALLAPPEPEDDPE